MLQQAPRLGANSPRLTMKGGSGVRDARRMSCFSNSLPAFDNSLYTHTTICSCTDPPTVICIVPKKSLNGLLCDIKLKFTLNIAKILISPVITGILSGYRWVCNWKRTDRFDESLLIFYIFYSKHHPATSFTDYSLFTNKISKGSIILNTDPLGRVCNSKG